MSDTVQSAAKSMNERMVSSNFFHSNNRHARAVRSLNATPEPESESKGYVLFESLGFRSAITSSGIFSGTA